MMAKNQTGRINELLAAATADLIDDSPQHFQDTSIRIERILLEMVRPDPVQPRRVLPERIHQAFHNSRLTPAQALRELVQLAQVEARMQGRPFSNVLELLPKPDDEATEERTTKLSPEEQLLRDLVNLAITIRDDGQVNALTVVDVSEGVSRMYRIETGERRYWATWLLREFIPGYEGDGMIECRVVPGGNSSIYRQAKENAARTGLTAIAMARQVALLLLTVNGYEIPSYAVPNDFYRQALDLRIPRGSAAEIYAAMGGIDKMYFSYIKKLLMLSDEAMELADRYDIDEGVLRHLTKLSPEDQIEMLQQIVQFGLTGKQVQAIVEHGIQELDEEQEDDLPAFMTKLAKMLVKDGDKFDADSLWRAVSREQRGSTHGTGLSEAVRSVSTRCRQLLFRGWDKYTHVYLSRRSETWIKESLKAGWMRPEPKHMRQTIRPPP